MTIAALALAWVALAILVRPPRTFLERLGPRAQAVASVLAILGLALIPTTCAVVLLSSALSASGGFGVRACGRLVSTVARDPLARLDLTAALLFVTAAPLLFARGAVVAWRSQSALRALIRRRDDGLVVIGTRTPLAFTAGLIRPRVVVSRGLLATASDAHRDVVLAHEEAHRRGRHPLLLFVAETLARALPFAPLRWAADALRFALESRADESAADAMADRAVVAEALARVALASAREAASFEGDEVRRVRRLLDSRRPAPYRSVVVVAVLLTVLAFAGGHSVHCAVDSAQVLATSQCRFHR